MQAKVKFDFTVQMIDYLGNTNLIVLSEFRLKEGSKTNIDKSLDLTFLIKVFFMFYISALWELRSSEPRLRRDGESKEPTFEPGARIADTTT